MRGLSLCPAWGLALISMDPGGLAATGAVTGHSGNRDRPRECQARLASESAQLLQTQGMGTMQSPWGISTGLWAILEVINKRGRVRRRATQMIRY